MRTDDFAVQTDVFQSYAVAFERGNRSLHLVRYNKQKLGIDLLIDSGDLNQQVSKVESAGII